MMFRRTEYETIQTVRAIAQQSSLLRNAQEKRKAVKIAVIDDNKFAALQNLRNMGFDIDELGDVKKIDEVAEYSVVLCDLMGVGAHFDVTQQGATIISEIRLNYPSKFVVAYTGAALRSGPVTAAKATADQIFKKDSHNADWKEMLDSYVDKAVDPYQVWMRFRKYLVDQDIDTLLLLKLEDAYVKSIRTRDPKFGRIKALLSEEPDAGRWKEVVLSVVATSALKLFISSM
jgi:hypothetical protein